MDASAVMLRVLEGVKDGDIDHDLIHPELLIDNVDGFLVQGPYHGHEGAERWRAELLEVAEEGFDFDSEVIEADAECVVMSHRVRGRFRETGLLLKLSWYSADWVRDGRLIRVRAAATREEALQFSRTPAPE